MKGETYVKTLALLSPLKADVCNAMKALYQWFPTGVRSKRLLFSNFDTYFDLQFVSNNLKCLISQNVEYVYKI